MSQPKLNDEWEALPDIYKKSFLNVLEERGLATDFDTLPDEYKSQILAIIKEHVLGQETSGVDAPPESAPSTDENS
jgi:hypothetical protein